MHPIKGPRQPISINPNGNPTYIFNPMENLSVEECAPWEHSTLDELKMVHAKTEPIFSSQTLDGSISPALKTNSRSLVK